LWRQILADILGVELVTVNTTEGAAYGAALLAGVGFGVWSDVLQACEGTVKITGSTTPAEDNIQIYQEYYQRYRTLYPALRDEFHAIAGVVQQYST
jgi:xylulokinase